MSNIRHQPLLLVKVAADLMKTQDKANNARARPSAQVNVHMCHHAWVSRPV
jgi:hypothetical protein